MKYKKISAVILIIVSLLCLFSCSREKSDETTLPTTVEAVAEKKPTLKAVWITCYELSAYLADGSESSFMRLVQDDFKSLATDGINAIIVQVRPFSDALYESKIFPISKYAKSLSGKTPAFDPLEKLISCAAENGLSVHAWINPYRVSYSDELAELDPKCPARIWLEDDDKTNDEAVIAFDGGTFYAPASIAAQKLIIDGVREIVKNYDVDAIHMDDYFYPSTSPEIDSAVYAKYTAAGGSMTLDDWRRENVNTLLQGMKAAIKAIKPEVLLGISPAGGIAEDYEKHYADVALWAKNDSYCDYLMPQLYFGYKNETHPFSTALSEWEMLAKGSDVDFYAGLASYKVNDSDKFAGDSIEAQNEWIYDSTVLSRQLKDVFASPHFNGCCFFSLKSIKTIFDKKFIFI